MYKHDPVIKRMKSRYVVQALTAWSGNGPATEGQCRRAARTEAAGADSGSPSWGREGRVPPHQGRGRSGRARRSFADRWWRWQRGTVVVIGAAQLQPSAWSERQVWHCAYLPCVANSYEFLALYICLSKEKAVFVGIEGLIQAEAECISV